MGTLGAEGGLVQDQMHLTSRTGRMDIYAQALKALAVRSPFGTEDASGTGGAASAGGPLVRLPTGETKRKNRARKTQAASNKRNFDDLDSPEAANPKLFWAQMEDYFREVTKEDIELLFPRTRLELVDSMLPQDPCFAIRPLGCRYTDVWAEEDRKHRLQVELDAEAALEQSVRGVKRKLLTASPVSKKRKTNLVASSTTDVITSVISPPETAGGEDLCHVCNGAESYEANQMVYCDSCNMAAHQECYGIRTVPHGQWLCSWCSAKATGEAVTTGAYSCVLCTVNGGALKPIAEAAGPPGQKRFAHLVCCQWVPETYVENTEAVEPIKNIEGIREERWGLICVICKLKHGACIQCSHGLCATAFHPLCARDAKYWMEVSSREDSQDVELRAYCQKHSSVKPAAEVSVILDGDKEKSPSEDAAVDFDDLKCFEDDEPAARVKVEDLPKCTISKAEEWTKEHSSSEELNDGGNDAGEFSARTGPCDSGEVNMEANSGEQTECESASVQPYVLPDILRRLRLLEQNASQRPLSEAGSGNTGEPHKGLEEVFGAGGHWEQLRRAKQSGLLDWSPQDELEAEIYILQNQLIDCAQANLCSSEKLIANVLVKLSTERQTARKIMQELTAVSQFISDLKEAKKLGRKERRDKEAQAILAAATAAAAASPRTGYVKRDTGGNEDAYYDAAADGRSNWLLSNGNQQSPTARPVKPPLPRPPRLNISNSFRVSQLEKLSSRTTPQSQDDNLTCDVCSNTSSVRSNRILQCYRCKVVVHQDCYGVPRLPAGPWYCQPCSEAQRQQQSGADSDAGYAAPQCALCPIKQGAFRRASDGRWVHVFCALWIPETTVGKEQTAAIGGLDAVPIERFNLICSVCQHQRGACVKCNFGHCYGAFHPICARDAGLYMSVKTIGGRTNYRAYCERHSSQQRAKADVKQYGSSDEMNALRQIRVEFERVRLICERISKRERIKRDLVICYKDLYITQLNLLALGGASQPAVEQSRKQAEANGSWYPSSEGGVLLEGAADSKLLASEPGAGEAGPWGRRRVFVDSSNGSKPNEGSQVEVPIRESKDHKKPRRCARHSEPLGREKVMTPSEASMHNKLLPKGYAYVPVDILEKGIVAVKQEQHEPEQADKKQELEHSSASTFLFTVVRELQRRTAQSSNASPASLLHVFGGPG